MANLFHNFAPYRRWLDAARTRRVDAALIGDSNVIFATTSGHQQGLELALDREFGCYASGVLPFAPNASWAAGRNGVLTSGATTGFNASTPPTELSAYALPASPTGFPDKQYAYLSDSESLSAGGTHTQLQLQSSSTVHDENLLFRWHVTYGTFTSGTGSFRPTVRRASTTTFIGDAGTINPVTGAYGVANTYAEVTAATRNYDIWFEPYRVLSGVDLTGPFLALYQRLEWPGITAGVALSTLLYQGGQSARDAASSLKDAWTTTPLALREWLKQAVRHQGVADADVMLNVYVVHGGNDRSDTDASWNPSTEAFDAALSNTADGLANNLRGIIHYLSLAWAAQGYDEDNLTFTLLGYHPQVSHTTTLQGYEDAAAGVADLYRRRVTVARGTEMATATEYTNNSWYDSGGDAHLTARGFENHWARHVLAASGAADMTPGVIPLSTATGVILLEQTP